MADEQKKIVIDMAGAMEKITPEMMAVFDKSLTEILSKRVSELEAALSETVDAFARQLGNRKHSGWAVIRKARDVLDNQST